MKRKPKPKYNAWIDKRACKAASFLQAKYGDTPETDVTDALTDLRHYCDQYGLDFHTLCDRSYQHYSAEHPDGKRQPQGIGKRNARLISELLEALRDALYSLKALDEDYNLRDSYKNGMAVIAKATGEA